MSVPVLYLDIDGTVRWGKDELGKFVNLPSDVHIFEEVPQMLALYRAYGWKIVGISNQAGIGLGHLTEEHCQAAMEETNRQAGDAFDLMQWCSHRPDEGCPCRKPKAGMVFTAQRKLTEEVGELPPLRYSLFVGDRPEDAECAKNAGLRFMPASVWRTGAHLITLGRGAFNING